MAMHADHSTICKFRAGDDPACELVMETIAAGVERALQLQRMWRFFASSFYLRVYPQDLRGIGQSDSITNSKVDLQPETVPSNVHWCIPRSVNTLFTGRSEILRRIKSAITTGDVNTQRRFVITGMGGQGKSEICLKIADQVREACVNVHLLLRACF